MAGNENVSGRVLVCVFWRGTIQWESMLATLFLFLAQTEPSTLSGADIKGGVGVNLLTEVVVISFAMIAIAAYYLKEKYSALQATRETMVAYRLAQHRRKEATLSAFTDGIPQNLALIHEIYLKRSYLRRLAKTKPEEREPYLDGRTYRQISLAYEKDVRLWLIECQHFTSICALVRARFDHDQIEEYATKIRQLFEELVALTPSCAHVREVAGTVRNIIASTPLLADSLPELDEAIKAVGAKCDAGEGASYDRLMSMSVARTIGNSIDKLFIQTTELMSDELKEPPIQGLKATSVKDFDRKMEDLESEERSVERTGRRRGIQEIREIGARQ